MRQKILTAILALAMVLGLTTAAAAAPNGGSVIEISEPVVVCDAENQISVAVSITTDVDLDGLWVQASRWEDVKPTMPGWSPRYDYVEHWAANFTADKGATVPTNHTLITSEATTWTRHSWIRDSYYTDNSDIFVINVNAWTNRKSKRNGQVWTDWTVDCGTAPATVIPFTYPWDVPWDHD